MASPAPTKRLTVEEFFEWANRPENQDRFLELDEGILIEMPPPGEVHGVLCSFIAHLLWQYIIQKRKGKGYVCGNDTGLVLKRRPATIRGPDIMLYDESRPLRKLSRRFAERIPRLVVEVLSPSDKNAQVSRRVSQYLQRGVPLVWVVDPEVQAITVYRPAHEHYVVEGADDITGEDVLPDLRYRVADFFALPGQEED